MLRKPFKAVTAALALKKKVTPRAMRRSFQDLARTAQVADVVRRSISGHATEQMQRHYSTVSETEQAEGLAKVLRMRTSATANAPHLTWDHPWDHRPKRQRPNPGELRIRPFFAGFSRYFVGAIGIEPTTPTVSR